KEAQKAQRESRRVFAPSCASLWQRPSAAYHLSLKAYRPRMPGDLTRRQPATRRLLSFHRHDPRVRGLRPGVDRDDLAHAPADEPAADRRLRRDDQDLAVVQRHGEAAATRAEKVQFAASALRRFQLDESRERD